MKLDASYYLQEDVVAVARDLIGKHLVTRTGGITTSGIITETEAYNGVTDKASHAFGGRRTARNEIMYARGGAAYIYLCYGIHHLFNVVTNKADIPHAVLIRAVFPDDNAATMYLRRGTDRYQKGITTGPGKVSLALGLTTALSGTSLTGNKIWLEDRAVDISAATIHTGPRIGVDYAGEDALLPYRFRIEHDLFL